MYLSSKTAFLLRKGLVLSFTAWFVLLSPVAAMAQEVTPEPEPQPTNEAVDATNNPTGAPADTGAPANTGAPACTGAGCGQGTGQGAGQGAGNGGPSLEDLGGYIDENGNEVLPAGVVDTRQGAGQGSAQGASTGDISGTNTGTGAGSKNTVDSDVAANSHQSVNNTVRDVSTVDAAGNTGGNTASKSTGSTGTTTGDASIGVTQLKNDNTTAINGTAGLAVSGYNGTYVGNLEIDFANAAALLAGDGGARSWQAINNTTGENSDNDVILSTSFTEVNEVQNDGLIDNALNLEAITGRNEASMNTGAGSIWTGNANIAATLVNLLNTTVINGNLMISVQDIFGDLLGNIVLPHFSMLSSLFAPQNTQINANNDTTGSNSDNTIDIDVEDKQKNLVDNNAYIDTNVKADAITGGNDTLANTGGGVIDTGNASVTASNVSLANTTVEGGNWGLVIVNSLNRWLGFLIGDSGEVRALSADETIRQIEASNSQTGANSENNIDIDDTTDRTNKIDNTARIKNDIIASAITGQNDASKNTGQGLIQTGNANILATAVNIANTTVLNANLGIAVINVFGDWFGDLLYAGSSLLAGSGGANVSVEAGNSTTGSESTNTIDVTVNREHATEINNYADINTTLDTNIDTGNNRSNKNTKGAGIETGHASLALHARSIANITGIAIGNGLSLDVNGGNDTTGFDSENTITARVNDERLITVNNDANVSTILPALVNTGHNQANQNTIGGLIDTGSIDANVAVSNLVNKFLLALGSDIYLPTDGGLVEVRTDLFNNTTGSESANENLVEAVRQLLVGVVNDADIENILDLIFNTGGNESNFNTARYDDSSYGNDHEDQVADSSATEDPADDEIASSGGGPEDNQITAASNVGGSGGLEDIAVSTEPAPNRQKKTAGAIAAAVDEPDDRDSGSAASGIAAEPEQEGNALAAAFVPERLTAVATAAGEEAALSLDGLRGQDVEYGSVSNRLIFEVMAWALAGASLLGLTWGGIITYRRYILRAKAAVAA